jgi:hypothetical protein
LLFSSVLPILFAALNAKALCARVKRKKRRVIGVFFTIVPLAESPGNVKNIALQNRDA